MKTSRKTEVAARIAVERTNEHFCAHTLYSEAIDFQPGDRVHVVGPSIVADTGDRFIAKRRAKIKRAGAIKRAWVRFISILEITGLYEVSFTGSRKP